MSWIGSNLCGDDFYAGYFDAFSRSALFTAAAVFSSDVCDAFENVVTGDKFAEAGVLAVKKLGITVADEKLRASGVGISRAGHRDHATHVRLFVKFGFNLIAGAAGSGHSGFTLFGVGAAALDHESLDDAMKGRAVVEAFFGELLEVFDRIGCDVRPEGKGQVSVGGLDDGLFVFVTHTNLVNLRVVRVASYKT